MPNRKQHQQVGLWAGAAYAGYHARNETAGDALLEAVGGAIAGYYASALPDILEPAKNNPRHRSVCHSCMALLLVALAAVDHERQQLRSKAGSAHLAAESAPTGFDAFLQSVLEMFYRIAAGALAGAQAGYLSHLAMDGNTPASLPFICRGL